MADKKKRQSKCKSDDYQKKKNTKGGDGSILPLRTTSVQGNIRSRKERSQKARYQKALSAQQTAHTNDTRMSVYIPSRNTVKPIDGHLVGKFVKYTQRGPPVSNSQQKHRFARESNQKLQNGLKQLQEVFHTIVVEKRLVCSENCNNDGVEILSTSCDGQQPPGGGKNVVILDYECFEEKPDGTPIDDRCCEPPIQSKCKKLINYIKELLKEILTEFFKSASSPEIFKFDIAKVAKACVVSYFIETITTQLINTSTTQPTDKKELVRFYIKVSVQAITGGKVKTARDFLVHVNVNSLKFLFEVPNINVLMSKIINNELKQIPNIVSEIKSVMQEVQQ
jgi:hypothetical protein